MRALLRDDGRAAWRETVTHDGSWHALALRRPPARARARARRTLVANGAGARAPALAACCAAASACLRMPVTANVYVTPRGVRVSAPPHTDAQDIVALQLLGAKTWRVWPRPAPAPGVDPYGRGKAGDAMGDDALGAAPGGATEATLSPTDALLVPRAFPHATTTADGPPASGRARGAGAGEEEGDDEDDDDVSAHVTLGVETHALGLTWAALRVAAARATAPRPPPAPRAPRSSALPSERFDALLSPLPFGFLGAASPGARGGAPSERSAQLADELLRRVRFALPDAPAPSRAAAVAARARGGRRTTRACSRRSERFTSAPRSDDPGYDPDEARAACAPNSGGFRRLPRAGRARQAGVRGPSRAHTTQPRRPRGAGPGPGRGTARARGARAAGGCASSSTNSPRPASAIRRTISATELATRARSSPTLACHALFERSESTTRPSSARRTRPIGSAGARRDRRTCGSRRPPRAPSPARRPPAARRRG